MSNKVASKTTAKKFTPAKLIKTLTEALMVKTGIKAGPEFTAR